MSESTSDGGTNIVAIVALIILAGLVILFFMFGLPMLKQATSQQMPSEIKVEIPVPTPAPTPAPQQ